MKKSLLKGVMAAMALGFAATANAATDKQAILIAEPSIDALNAQEKAAAEFFVNKHDGIVITPSTLDLLESENLEVVWIHIDRIEVEKSNLPFDEATITALKQYVANGGNLLLTKHATQLVAKIGRVAPEFDINIYSNGQGGEGFDDWTLNAYLGYWQENPVNQGDKFPEQIYDRTTHAIYAGLTTSNNYAWTTFPMEGTGNLATSMWREDHNCLWDLNAYQYSVDGANTVEKFENQNNCVVLGTWGHVQDYAVAGIVEFLPQTAARSAEGGTILANGLAACEWAPRNGGNAYHSNLERLTSNSLNYLTTESGTSGIADVEAAESSAAEYFTLQGVRVAEPTAAGIYIKRQGNKATKVIIK